MTLAATELISENAPPVDFSILKPFSAPLLSVHTSLAVLLVSAAAGYLVDNPERRCPVIAKAREHLGYDPTISLDDGIERTLLWYRDNREGSEA